ncbi:MAG: nicotinate-nucleotide adenylyltransferase [Nitriliruptoraceae bacterium]
MSRRVGLLGGTFDPPHLGHLVVAECARVELALDEVRLLVAGDPYQKSTTSSPGDRVAMVAAAVAEDEHLRVDDRELAREGPTYTADTLAELGHEEPDVGWYFILGEDAAAGLSTWDRVDEAFALARFVVVTRPDARGPEVASLPGPVVHLEIPQLQVSSTELRARYEDGRATRYLVPLPVDAYIRSRSLYGDPHG